MKKTITSIAIALLALIASAALELRANDVKLPDLVGCSRAGNDVTLRWINVDETIERMEVIRDGTIIANVALSATSYTDVAVASGTHLYQLRAFTTDGTCVGGPECTVTEEELPDPGFDTACSCAGTEFWLTFPGNYAPDRDTNPVKPLLEISAEATATVFVEIPGLDFFEGPITVAPGSPIEVALPGDADLGEASDAVLDRGIHVVSDLPVTIHGIGQHPETGDGYLALPVSVLAKDTIVLGFENTQPEEVELNFSQLAIVATENRTRVDVTLSAPTAGYEAGESFLVRLQQGEVYQLVNTGASGNDLSGTIIQANHPVSVFGGNACATVPDQDTFFCNYLVEHLPPSGSWGTEFVVQPLESRTRYSLRVVASTDTQITINGGAPISIGQAQVYRRTSSNALYIEADDPVLVAQYAHGTWDDGAEGDPMMMLIAPTEHYADAFHVDARPTPFLSWINVVTISPGDVRVNGAIIPSSEFVAVGSSPFSAASYAISPGSTEITSDTGTAFGVNYYAFAHRDAVGFPLCFQFGDDGDKSKWEQDPFHDGYDVPSSLDWERPDLMNSVVADDFISDGRPITGVRWWGSYTDPFFRPDVGNKDVAGWILSFHTNEGSKPGDLLGLYFCRRTDVEENLLEREVGDPVTPDNGWTYWPGTVEPSEGTLDWTKQPFDDSSWFTGNANVGYGHDDVETQLDDMRFNYTSVYMRRTFDIQGLQDIQRLRLDIEFSGGFVAYLNGSEIGRRRVPGNVGQPVPVKSVASGPEGDGTARILVDRERLRLGENILALHALTDNITEDDFRFVPGLRNVPDEGDPGEVQTEPVVGCDDHEVYEYLAYLRDCCPIHVELLDNRTGHRPALRDRFEEERGVKYWLGIQAVASHGWATDCVTILTNQDRPNPQTDSFWGWHNGPEDPDGAPSRESITGKVHMDPNTGDWFYDSWAQIPGAVRCRQGRVHQAFHLITNGCAPVEASLPIRQQEPGFVRGDCNGDGKVEGSPVDAVFLLRRLFQQGAVPPCVAACDVDGSGQLQMSDGVTLLMYLFMGGPPPPAPYPECGPLTPSDVELGCESPPERCR